MSSQYPKYQLRIFILLVLFLAGCATSPSKKQKPTTESPTPSQDKKVALVLGGGGVASFATVGLLKKLKEENIQISYIVTTGWPSLFAMGYGFFRSIHDLEWFAMKLRPKDLYSSGIFDFKKGYASHQRLRTKLGKAFKQTRFGQASIPIVLASSNLLRGNTEYFRSGAWRNALLKAMSLPGIFRPYAKQWIFSQNGLDVDRAVQRGADVIVAVNMYDDYFSFLKTATQNNSESVFRALFLDQIRKTTRNQMAKAQIQERIILQTPPTNFSAKRRAIQAGYKLGARLANKIRSF